MASPRVLTYNFHEPYICLLAKTGLPITCGLYDKPAFKREWKTAFRAVPPNVSFLEESQWRDELAKGKFDVVLAQNEDNANDIAQQVIDSQTPALLLLHNRRDYIEAMGKRYNPEAAKNYGNLLEKLRNVFGFVYISESKRRSYGIPGRVVPPGIDVDEHGGYRGDKLEVLRVGNMMRARTIMFDVDFQEEVCAGIPNRVMGEDPQIPGARPSTSFKGLLEAFRAYRCYLHVSREEFEDGYNLAMLEAMACGAPVVALQNMSSPIRDGYNGFISDSAEVLRTRIHELFDDIELARRLGQAGRETVAEWFPIDKFTERWKAAFEEAAETSPLHTGQFSDVTAHRVATDYVASPATTGRYIEDALRMRHEVVSAGFRIPEEVLFNWGFPSPAPTYLPQQVPTSLEPSAAELVNGLPKDFAPQFYVWIDSGLKELPPDFDQIPGIKICYLIDTHIAPELRIDIAKRFDHVFLAQKGQVDLFRANGVPSAKWLPLAASADLHRLAPQDRIYDVAYVGRFADDPGDRRRRLLDSIRNRFPNHRIEQVWPETMARVYNQSKIVVNACVNRDVNMRVFETMASGALLITDDADGLDDLFEEDVHYVRYRDDAAVLDLIAYYLEHDEERAKIAEAGREIVFARHTYAHRTHEMIHTVLDDIGAYGGLVGESRFERGGYYRSGRSELLPIVPEDAQRVLDCGCGGGEFGRQLKERGVKEVIGIEVVERAWEIAKENLDQVLLGSIEDMELPFADNYFDCVCFNDVLEHLIDPLGAIKRAMRALRPGGTVIISIPNARFYEVIAMLANGRWKYEEAGIMDRTHLRFFTAVELVTLLDNADLDLAILQPLSRVPESQLPREPNGDLRLGRVVIEQVSDSELTEFCTYQWLAVAVKPAGTVLERAKDALADGANERAYELGLKLLDDASLEGRMVFAKAAARLGKLDEAEKVYRHVVSEDGGNLDAAGELGILFLSQNRTEDARKLLEPACQQQAAPNSRFVGALGLVHVSQGHWEEAFELLREALDASMENEALVPHLMDVAHQLNRFEDIEPLLDRFVSFFPGQVDIGCRFARTLMEQGKAEKARSCLETILLLSPEHEEASGLLAALGND